MYIKNELLERIEVYERLLRAFQQAQNNGGSFSGYCIAIVRTFGIDVYKISEFEKHFPELLSVRPRQTTFWFAPHDMNNRIELLKNVIDKFYTQNHE